MDNDEFLNTPEQPPIKSFVIKLLFALVIFLGSIFFLSSSVLAITDIVSNSSTVGATQPSTMRHLHRTSEGTLHAFVQMGTSTVKCGSGGLWWLYSTDAGSTWTCGGQLSSDTTNLMYADVRADSSDNLYLVYSVAGSGGNAAYDVVYRRLTSANCSPAPCDWTMQAAQTVLDGDASGDNAGFHYAVIELEGTTRAWIAVREYDGTNYQVGTYYSGALSDAPTWTDSQVTLDTAGTNASYHYPTIARYGTNLAVIWNDQTTGDLYWRSRSDSDGLTAWNAAGQIANRLTRFPTFSALGDTAGNIYLSVQDASVGFYHYFSSWSSTATVASPSVSDQFTSVGSDGTNVYVAYGDTTGITGGVNRKLAYKKGIPPFATANFDSTATPLVPYHGVFDQVWLYDASADTYEDETTDSASITTADMGHSDSTRIVKDTGDIIYLGKSTTYDAFSWVVSSVSSGGTNSWEYCSAVDATPTCTTWTPITFTVSQNAGWKGNGYGAFTTPGDWQASKVNGEGTAYYYVRDLTTSSYTTGPIGTQVTTIPQAGWPSLAASTNGIYALWTENASSPMRVRYTTVLSFNSNPNSPTSLGGHVLGSYTPDQTPTLSFNLSDSDVTDTVQYHLQIDDSSDFSSAVVDYTSALAAQGSFSFTVGQSEGSGNYTAGSSGQTLGDGSYYWRVKTIDDDLDESSYSLANSGAVAFILDATAPSVPGTPVSSSLGTDTTPTWTWTASSDAGSGLAATPYTLQWSQAADFSSGVFSSTSATNSFTHSTALSDSTWYFRLKSSDAAGNESGYSSSGSQTVDATSPTSFELESPADSSYTNSERPTLKWKASSDETVGLSKYILEVDNPSLGSDYPTGDFIIDNIPTTGTQDHVTNRYVVHYENFSDSDQSNNYISLFTKSHSEWGSSENDGRLREGKVTWRVKAVDNAGNESSSSRTLFLDRTNPLITLTQINSVPYSSNNYSTTDSTPTVFGKITDSLFGGDPNQIQDKTGPRVAAGPSKIEVRVEKDTLFGYELITLYTLNADKIYYVCNGKEVVSSAGQQCDKYLLFEYTSNEILERGTYRLTFTGHDRAGNISSQNIINLTLTASTQPSTTEPKKTIETLTDSTAKTESNPKFTTTKALESSPQQTVTKITTDSPNDTEPSSDTLIGKIFTEIGDSVEKSLESTAIITSKLTATLGDTYQQLSSTAPAFIKTFLDGVGSQTSSFVGAVSSLTSAVADGTLTFTKNSAAGLRNGTIAVISATGKAIQNSGNALRNGIAGLAFALGENTKNISENFSLAVIEFAYKFVTEPTTISQVKVEILSPTSAKISWETNQPANGKVNYGLDRTYPFDVQSEARMTHHEFVITDLQPDTTYHFEVMSQNKNYVYDANREFRTPPSE